MGYSEVKCTLCGVSFNLCRIRTPNEPREAAWSYFDSDKPGTSFREVDDMCDFEFGCNPADFEYPGQEGCMVAFREDEAVRMRAMTRARTEEEWDASVYGGLEVERVDLGVDESDEDWVPGEDVKAEDGVVDVESMYDEPGYTSEGKQEDAKTSDEGNYEYRSDSETQDDDRDVDMDDSEDKKGLEDQSEYRAWTEKVLASAHMDVGYAYPSNSRIVETITRYEKLRCLAEEFRAKVPSEVKLPLYVTLESLEEPFRSAIKEGLHEHCTETRDGKEIILSTLKHSLNALGPEDGVWEHLAGPDCGSTRGYHGDRISLGEMRNCNVAQGLIGKDANRSWDAESTDEDWEGRGSPGWYLTGLVDQPSERQSNCRETYPNRHPDRIHSNGTMMDNIQFDVGGVPSVAMAFHPTCLEVFKRASIKRYGRCDIPALGNWWRECSSYAYVRDFPRAAEVRPGRSEQWEHHVGHEFLAANSCFVPSLKEVLESSRRADTANADVKPTTREGPNALSRLPVEIQRSIMFCLGAIDVASISIALPELRTVAEGVLQNGLLVEDMPYLWELWCDNLPYSRWTGTTAAKIRAGINALNEQEEEIERVLDILEEEGYNDERAQYKTYWDGQREERRQKSRVSMQEKPVDFVDIQKLDLVELVLRLDKARTEGELKGLRNRERIWIDCNVILDRIEELQEEGRIPPPS